MPLTEVNLTIPESLLGMDDITIIDIPGIEDQNFTNKLQNYLKKYSFQILPVLIINLTQGTTSDLVQFQNVFSSFNDLDIKIPIIFTHYSEIKLRAEN